MNERYGELGLVGRREAAIREVLYSLRHRVDELLYAEVVVSVGSVVSVESYRSCGS